MYVCVCVCVLAIHACMHARPIYSPAITLVASTFWAEFVVSLVLFFVRANNQPTKISSFIVVDGYMGGRGDTLEVISNSPRPCECHTILR